MGRKKVCVDCGDPYTGAGTRCSECGLEASQRRNKRRPSSSKMYPKEYQDNRRKLLKTFGYCALKFEGVCTQVADTADHIRPLVLGGTHDISNLQPACKACNSAKGVKVL